MRLNGWQRSGIVLSVLWVLISCCYLAIDMRVARFDSIHRDLDYCMEHPEVHHYNCSLYLKEADDDASQGFKDMDWTSIGIASVLPVIFAWFITYIGIAICRWVRCGFVPVRKEKKSNQGESYREASDSEFPLTRIKAFEILGLKEGASRKEIQAARKRLLKGLHPDAGGSNPLASLINQAADFLLK